MLELGHENLHILLAVGEQLKDSCCRKETSSSEEGHMGVGEDWRGGNNVGLHCSGLREEIDQDCTEAWQGE